MTVLFLDIATTTGWASGPASAERPAASGVIRLARGKDVSTAVKFGALLDWLVARLSAERHRMVIFEAPIGPGMDRAGLTNYSTKYLLTGLCAVAEAACHCTRTPVAQASAASIRKALLPAKPGKGEAKAAVLAEVRRRGFTPTDDNEADAIAGWLHATAEIRRLGDDYPAFKF